MAKIKTLPSEIILFCEVKYREMNIFKQIHDLNWEFLGELSWNDPCDLGYSMKKE